MTIRKPFNPLILMVTLCLIGVCFPPHTARATWEQELDTETFTKYYVLDKIPEFSTLPKGGLDWRILGTTREIPFEEKDENGFDLVGVRPEFTDTVKSLDGKEVIMQGYMFPLDETELQSTFLYGPFPISCPFHYHVGSSLVIEVHMAKPIYFSEHPFNLKGTLELVPKDDEFNVFYRMKNAVRLSNATR